mgnify:CR=1 FL=1
MSTASKNKGDRAERALVEHLRAAGFPRCRRTKAGGEKDMGDLSGVVDAENVEWCVQVTDRTFPGHGALLAKAATVPAQAKALGTDYWCMVVKRPRATDVGDWFVWLPLAQLLSLVTYESVNEIRGVVGDDLACVTVRAWIELVGPEVRNDPEIGGALPAQEDYR